jgi:hypothetical protein
MPEFQPETPLRAFESRWDMRTKMERWSSGKLAAT